jgi:uncharacterized membrane protein
MILKAIIVSILLLLSAPDLTVAAEYETGKVSEVQSEQILNLPEGEFFVQELVVIIDESGQKYLVPYGSEYQPLNRLQRLATGTPIVVFRNSDATIQAGESDGPSQTAIYEEYRLPVLMWLAAGFFLLVLGVAGYKGLFAILGMFISIGVLLLFVIPQILVGTNALVVTMVAALIIAVVTVYLSHGWKPSSHLALVSILLTLVLVSLLSYWFVTLSRLTGMASEEAAFLQVEHLGAIDFRGLLLSGIMLGALGVLDDIAVTQVATVFELKRANRKLDFVELYERAMRVGRDHVASLVNTLVLAYTGANLPMFLLFVTNSDTPSWVHLNSAILAEEIVRTLIGSIGLVAAVPITTALAAYWIQKMTKIELDQLDVSAHKH